MIAYINGIKVEGTPEEISRFKKIEESKKEKKDIPEGVNYEVYDKDGSWIGDI